MLWLAAQGHRVLGVELSQRAVEQFFAEHGLQPKIDETRYGRRYRADGPQAGDIELICGDAFALDAAALADCDAVLDRAAMIALPPALRLRYVDALYACLPARCRGLLITLEYPQGEKEGPPFAVTSDSDDMSYDVDALEQVSEADYRAHTARHADARWDVDLLERRDILAAEQTFIDEGVTALHTCVYRLQRHAG